MFLPIEVHPYGPRHIFFPNDPTKYSRRYVVVRQTCYHLCVKRPHPLFFLVGFILLGAFWQIASLFLGNAPITNYPPKGSRIIALGDSLTVGVGASAPEKGFVAHLEQRLGVTIENFGVSGNTTRDGVLRLQKDVLDKKPDIVIVLLGGNDYLQRIPEKETFANLRTIITKIQEGGAVVLLLGIRGGLLADHFDDNFEELAKETGVAFVPNVLDNIIGDTKLMSDQIHPNDAGYEKIADKVAPTLLFILPPKAN